MGGGNLFHFADVTAFEVGVDSNTGEEEKGQHILEAHLDRQLDLASGIPGIGYLAELRRA